MKSVCLILVILFCSEAHAALVGKDIEYKEGTTVLQGYIVYDNSFRDTRPGILIFHEWKGLTGYEKGRALQLAKMGYIVFAADVYGKGVRAKDNEEAAKLSGIYLKNRGLLRARVGAALDELRKNLFTDKRRIAAIGYCFGGAAALELARSGADIKGAATFHGVLENPAPEDDRNIKAKILVLHGAADPLVKIEQVLGFWKEMDEAKIDWQLNVYGNAVHRFTVREAGNNPSSGMAYNADADRRSWEALKIFLKEIFKR